MTKTASDVFLSYIKDLLMESGAPYTGYGNISLNITVQDGVIINLKITEYEASIKPK